MFIVLIQPVLFKQLISNLAYRLHFVCFIQRISSLTPPASIHYSVLVDFDLLLHLNCIIFSLLLINFV